MSTSTIAQPSCRGPLTGLRVLEFASIGPGPHCGMLLSDLGAEVLRIDRAGGNGWPNPFVDRGRAPIEVDIRSDIGRNLCIEAAEKADVVIEGFRPGVMERLGLGPEVLLDRNPRLIYGRVTGWGQTGPLSRAAGHDINYVALTGALAAMGPPGSPPPPPLNLVGDFGGGSLYLALGILAALRERERSGCGQIIDAAIVDGVSSMMSMFTGLIASGHISVERDQSLLGGAAPYYRCYACADGLYVAVGAIEPHFYLDLMQRTDAPAHLANSQRRPEDWKQQSEQLAALFATKTRDEWCALLEGTDACFAPVLSISEAPDHPQMSARDTYIRHDGSLQPAPAPRFSRTPGQIGPTGNGLELLNRWGIAAPPC